MTEVIRASFRNRPPEAVTNIQSYSLAGLLKILQQPKNCEDMYATTREIVTRMETQNLPEVLLGAHDVVYTLDGDAFLFSAFAGRATFPLVADVHSPALESLFVDLSLEQEEKAKNNIRYVVFTPHLLNCAINNPSVSELRGLSFGQHVVYVDTWDANLPQSEFYASILAHEAEHEGQQNLNYSRLQKEKKAYEAELLVLVEQKHKGVDGLDAMIQDHKKRVRNAAYLLQGEFGDDFSHVYPWATIRSDQLLEAKISLDIVAKYAGDVRTGHSAMDAELQAAAEVTRLTLQETHAVRTTALYTILESNKTGRLQKKNAYAALEFLSPGAFMQDKRIQLGAYSVPPLEILLTAPTAPLQQMEHIAYLDVLDGDTVYALRDEGAGLIQASAGP